MDLADQYFGFINHSLNEFLVAANQVDFDQAYKTIKTNLSMFVLGLRHPDRIKCDGMRLFVKYMSSVLATMQDWNVFEMVCRRRYQIFSKCRLTLI